MVKRNRMDMALLVPVAFLLIAGLAFVYSASAVNAGTAFGDSGHFLKRQALFAVAGFLLMGVFFAVPYPAWERATVPLLGISFLLLILVLTPLGHKVNGAQRWFQVRGISLQPVELAKVAVVLYLARYLSARGERMRLFPWATLPPLVVLGVVIAVTLLQPDMGNAVFIALLGAILLFAGGGSVRILAAAGVLALPLAGWLIAGTPYRMERIRAFLDPWEQAREGGFQLVQSFLALGSGGFWGTGLGQGKSKLFYLPEPHTDFILAVVGEELGFLGILGVMVLFALVVVRGLKVARETDSSFGSLLAAGFTLLIGLQALFNALVVVGLIPTKGLPLPFVSYGGSSLLASMAAMGILLAVSAGRENR